MREFLKTNRERHLQRVALVIAEQQMHPEASGNWRMVIHDSGIIVVYDEDRKESRDFAATLGALERRGIYL